MKRCTKCGEYKSLTGFIPRAESPDGFRHDCRECVQKRQREWDRKTGSSKKWRQSRTAEQKEAVMEYKRKWRVPRRDAILEKQRLDRLNNPSKHLEQARRSRMANRRQRVIGNIAYCAKRRLGDPAFDLICRLRDRIRSAIKSAKTSKSNTSKKLIGCTPNELMAHIQSLFKPGMNWNNRKLWHIDHIKPCVSFDLINLEEQRKCFHYTNLQPLWASENMAKGAKEKLLYAHAVEPDPA